MTVFDEDDSALQHRFMGDALREAEKAAEIDEVPVGCVIVHQNRIVGRGYNQRERLQDATAHAEMIAITAGCETLGSWRLEGCTMYVTLEPCAMCAGAIILSRIPHLVFGADDPKSGACGTLYDLMHDDRLNHEVDVISGIRAEESQLMLKSFFDAMRRRDR
jgi:tRNA(adenine34) deaminase